MLKIWGRKTSSNVQKVLWCCGELEIPFERVDLGGEYGGNREQPYLGLNPNGVIPTIEDGDFVLWESNSILRYLVNKYNGGKLRLTKTTVQEMIMHNTTIFGGVVRMTTEGVKTNI